MGSDILQEILESCLSLEKKAAAIFRAFAAHADRDDARSFWETVAAETNHHSALYERLNIMNYSGISRRMLFVQAGCW